MLSKEEWKSFKKWLNSPWANSNKRLVLLYEAIEKGYPKFEEKKWEKENIYQKVYPQKTYNNKVFNNLLSNFYTQLKSFITHNRLKNKEEWKEFFFTKELLEKGTYQLFEETSRAFIQQLETKSIKDTNDYWLLAQLYSQLYYHPSSPLRHRSDSTALEQAKQYASLYYQLNDLRYEHDIQIRATLLKDYTPPQLHHSPVLSIELLQMRLDRPRKWMIQDYQDFKNLYLDCYKDLPRLFQQYFLYCCINDSIYLSKQKALDGIREIFSHFQFGFDHNLLTSNGRMTAVSYNNIVLTASHLEEYDFAKKIVHTYSSYLEESLQEEGYHWGQAELCYIAKDFEQAITILRSYSFSSHFFKRQSVGTLLKAYFERYQEDNNELDNFLSLCKAKERYFHRNPDFSEEIRLAYIRFIQFLHRLALLMDTPSIREQKIEKYKKDLQQTNLSFGKGWLLKKLDLLHPVSSN